MEADVLFETGPEDSHGGCGRENKFVLFTNTAIDSDWKTLHRLHTRQIYRQITQRSLQQARA